VTFTDNGEITRAKAKPPKPGTANTIVLLVIVVTMYIPNVQLFMN